MPVRLRPWAPFYYSMYVIPGNFGNHSLAVMQALIEKGLTEVHFLYINTGWAAACWPKRVTACSAYAKTQGVKVHQLNAQATFTEMVTARKQFPSPKFQWCASFLKGLTLLNYLDEHDPFCEAVIVSGKRQSDSRRYADLQEFDHQNELYQGRTLWYPLWQTTDTDFIQLLKRAGFEPLSHPSLECSPCIHVDVKQISHLESSAIDRLDKLEQTVQQSMFQHPIRQLCAFNQEEKAQQRLNLQQFDLGCGAPWGCGE
ncbi:Phosphoadenosine phosphosulfate reductase family protein [Legionella jamestowniensis]|uniref:Phosphoadenosine phosphosulfate reductase family protein n=2 Tax=Legionella jamestowniensis TaxID=455 RepID=A0A0W0UL37_9GAMM|nr:Phosphoadenosine phosphosulfate reductase family protein [Legionella jamestowniensis]